MRAAGLRRQLGGINQRALSALVDTAAVPTSLSRLIGSLHARAMHGILAVEAGFTASDPRHYLAKLLAPGARYVDIGASYGTTVSIGSVAVGPSGAVFAFEPNPRVMRSLQRRKDRLGWNNVRLIQALVGETDGDAELFVDEDNDRMSSTSAEWSPHRLHRVQCRSYSLDGWAEEQRVDAVQCVKVDVEGAELSVLKGGQSLLRSCHPLLLLEINNPAARMAQFGYTIGGMLDELYALGYQHLYVLRSTGRARIVRATDLQTGDHDLIASRNVL